MVVSLYLATTLPTGLALERCRAGPQSRRMTHDVELEDAAFDQRPYLLAVPIFGEQRAAGTGVRLVHRVCEHRLHHQAFLGVRLPEPALEAGQHRPERGVVPAFDARL